MVQGKVDHFEEKFRMLSNHLTETASVIDRNEHAKCASITAMISEQEDIRRLVEELASRLDQPQERNTATQGEPSTTTQLEVSDLKAKVLRLTEQCTEHAGKLSYFAGMSEQVNLLEAQIIKWRYRLPDLTDDHSRERVVTAVELKEDLDKFKDKTMEKVREVNNALVALEREVQLFERDVMILGRQSVID